ncbi:HAD family hydrolase [Nocardioides limicola]|uniref:HAD family hydrolase n=1 Tax=Nocardioides limicola TaxID=2803368 RepID=UPI00193C799B|nr:HAD-IA family hydrolase [Nocardioides sp. DJM-14]
MDWKQYDAALFDLDGVITPTAEVHMRAWSQLFTEFLTSRGLPDPYTDADYFAHVDGKPRYDGVRDFLESRGISLPEGTPEDDIDVPSVHGLGNRKNEAFNAVLATTGVVAYPGSVALLDHLAALGMPLAVVSSSANAPAVLEAAGLLDRFGSIVDGRVAVARGLAGKPSPETFVLAAEELGAPVTGSVVIEDAVSGVRAGANGGFGLVIGVDRGAGAADLTAAGADLVVTDLAELVDGAPA